MTLTDLLVWASAEAFGTVKLIHDYRGTASLNQQFMQAMARHPPSLTHLAVSTRRRRRRCHGGCATPLQRSSGVDVLCTRVTPSQELELELDVLGMRAWTQEHASETSTVSRPPDSPRSSPSQVTPCLRLIVPPSIPP